MQKAHSAFEIQARRVESQRTVSAPNQMHDFATLLKVAHVAEKNTTAWLSLIYWFHLFIQLYPTFPFEREGGLHKNHTKNHTKNPS